MQNDASAAVPGDYSCEVLENVSVGPDMCRTRFASAEIAAVSRPGQFVNILTSESYIPLLRKPFSISRRSLQGNWFEVLYRVVGEGTRLLSIAKPGERRRIIGPLGVGFRCVVEAPAAIVAGGLGVAPMPFLLEELSGQCSDLYFLLGARTAAELWGEDVARSFAARVFCSTDDGSKGFAGTVTALFEHLLDTSTMPRKRLHVYACGPEPLLQRMLEISRERKLQTQISVETMMGCGFGICMGCPMPPAAGEMVGAYKLSCIDGPVFDAREIEISW